MPSRSRREYGAVYSFPFGALLRSDIHVRGGLPSHTVHGSLKLVIAYATVFIIADMRIIPHIFEKINTFGKYLLKTILLIAFMPVKVNFECRSVLRINWNTC